MSNKRFDAAPLPNCWYKPKRKLNNSKGNIDGGIGSAEIIMLDVSKLNKHNFYFMENILDKVTEEQLEVSKKLGEIRDTLKRWSEMTKDTQEKAILIDLSKRVSDAEQDYDNWMLEVENE